MMVDYGLGVYFDNDEEFLHGYVPINPVKSVDIEPDYDPGNGWKAGGFIERPPLIQGTFQWIVTGAPILIPWRVIIIYLNHQGSGNLKWDFYMFDNAGGGGVPSGGDLRIPTDRFHCIGLVSR